MPDLVMLLLGLVTGWPRGTDEEIRLPYLGIKDVKLDALMSTLQE
jgi:hypothetical protein